MALRGTLTHRKTRRLASLLKIAPYAAMGALEALWHVTAEHHNDGGIGRMSNQDIADEMYYDRDSDKLIDALLKAGWLDSMENTVSNGRLYVHDWHLHSDESVNSKLIQWTKLYANGEPPRLRKLSYDARERTIQKYEKRFGAVIGQKMRSVRADADGAHDARIQYPESSIQNPETDERTSTPVAPPAPTPEPQSARSSSPPIGTGKPPEIPRKPLASPNGAAAAKIVNPERIAAMRAELHGYMTTENGIRIRPPDDGIVLKCLQAVGDVSMDDVHQYLRKLRNTNGQGPGMANGPKTYPWFVPVLQRGFRKAEGARG